MPLPIAPLVTLNRDELRDKIYGCWLGKNIGGTLGGPYETRRDILDIQGYLTPPGEPLANDDLDLQLVWLKAVQERGPLGITASVLGEYWLNYISAPWSEYGISKANQRAGLAPPLSGMYNNPWRDSNGAWIRSEIWACLAPGCPDVAIRLAYEDAAVDHGGAEGMYAELFTAAVESAAFVVSDRDELLRIGLAKIPASCRVARAIRVATEAHAQGRTWQEAREAVVADSVPDLGWLMAPANVAFFVIGWLYGEGDFGLSVRIAANCGDDTDCTAATMGALLGIIGGRQGIPSQWTEPLGDRIITVSIDCGSYLDYPRTLADLTERVMEQVRPTLVAFRCPVQIGDEPTDLARVADLHLDSDAVAQSIWARPSYAVVHDLVHTRVTVDFGRAPEIVAGEPFRVTVTLENPMPDQRHVDLIWHLPEGWRVLPGPRVHAMVLESYSAVDCKAVFEMVADQLAEPSYRIILEVVAQGRPTVGLIPMIFFNGAYTTHLQPDWGYAPPGELPPWFFT